MNRFVDTQNFAIKIANMAFATTSEKEKIKEEILKEIALCCIRYSKIPEYKTEIDQFIEYQKMKERY